MWCYTDAISQFRSGFFWWTDLSVSRSLYLQYLLPAYFSWAGFFYKQQVKTHNTLPVGEQKCLDIIKSITVGLTGDGIPMTMSSLKQWLPHMLILIYHKHWLDGWRTNQKVLPILFIKIPSAGTVVESGYITNKNTLFLYMHSSGEDAFNLQVRLW